MLAAIPNALDVNVVGEIPDLFGRINSIGILDGLLVFFLVIEDEVCVHPHA